MQQGPIIGISLDGRSERNESRMASKLAVFASETARQTDPTFESFEKITTRPWTPWARRLLPANTVNGTPNPAEEFDEEFSDSCLSEVLTSCTWAPDC
jgi:hypothetical protein